MAAILSQPQCINTKLTLLDKNKSTLNKNHYTVHTNIIDNIDNLRGWLKQEHFPYGSSMKFFLNQHVDIRFLKNVHVTRLPVFE